MVNGFSANKAETAGSICVLMYIVFSYLHTVPTYWYMHSPKLQGKK